MGDNVPPKSEEVSTSNSQYPVIQISLFPGGEYVGVIPDEDNEITLVAVVRFEVRHVLEMISIEIWKQCLCKRYVVFVNGNYGGKNDPDIYKEIYNIHVVMLTKYEG